MSASNNKKNKQRYLDEPYTTPHNAAEIARANPRPKILRKQFVDNILDKQPLNKTAISLRKILARQDHAHDMLSMLGYDSVRHLQADGQALSEIAHDLDMSILDLMSFMSMHPEAEAHAELDALACADAKMRKYINKLESSKFLTKFDGDKARLELDATLQFCKRLSNQWAGVVQKINEQQLVASQVGINISMDFTGDLSSMPTKTHHHKNDGHEEQPTVIDITPTPTTNHNPNPVDNIPVYEDPLAVTRDD